MTTIYLKLPNARDDWSINLTDVEGPLEHVPRKGETVTVNRKKYTVRDVETVAQKPTTYVDHYWNSHVIVHLKAKAK